ncbi:tetratricopeptide repeat protein [Anaerosinus massiliensis]|uniref:tetratricopeptide repeat protein n=1 Tax=Massilibacillus massiliensis TaxID=1806837 RepID=UPI000DA6054B|nr:hypothetical protein [Massilibacillus massiliensis]
MKIKKKNKTNKQNHQVVNNTKTKQIDMNKVKELKEQVLQYKAEENYEEAMIAISEIFTLEYYGTEVMYDLAEIFYITEDFERAEIWSKKVLSFDSKHAQAYLLLARIYAKGNRMSELFSALEKLLKNSFVEIRGEVETLLEEIHIADYEFEAVDKYKNIYNYIQEKHKTETKAASLVQEKTVETQQQITKTSLSNLQNLLKGLEKQQEEKETLSDLIDEVFISGLDDRLVKKFQAEDLENVLSEIARHAANDVKKVEVLNEIAVSFYMENHLDKALAVLVKAIQMDAEKDRSLKNLSFVLFYLGEKELALQYLNQIVGKDIAIVDLTRRIQESC